MEIPEPCRIARPLTREDFSKRQKRLDIIQVHNGRESAPWVYLAEAYGEHEIDRRKWRKWCQKQGFD